jgi:hypothetical protein
VTGSNVAVVLHVASLEVLRLTGSVAAGAAKLGVGLEVARPVHPPTSAVCP